MSGIKKATVSQNLNRTLKTVEDALAECASMADSTGKIGKSEYENKRKSATTIHNNIARKLPDDIAPFVRGET